MSISIFTGHITTIRKVLVNTAATVPHIVETQPGNRPFDFSILLYNRDFDLNFDDRKATSLDKTNRVQWHICQITNKEL